MSILDSFKLKVSTVLNKFKVAIIQFAQAFLPKVGAQVEVALEDLAAVAGQAVLAQASQVISGQTKFDNAVNTVVSTVKAEGKTVAINTAKAAVQIAYLEAQRIAQDTNQ